MNKLQRGQEPKLPGMVRCDLAGQFIYCTRCKEVIEVPRKLLRDQHALMVKVEDTDLDHIECAEYTDLRLAIIARQTRKRIEREERKAAKRAAA